MPFAYFNRLTAEQKRIYRRSDEIHAIPVPNGATLSPLVEKIAESLRREPRK